MIVAGMDLESTGLDKVKDRPIELGVTLWTTKYSRGLDSQSILIKSDGVPVVSEITEITGITQDMVDNFGYEPDEAFEVATSYADRAQAIVAFNGRRFDIPMFQAMAKRLKRQWPDKLIIDPFVDLPMRGQELITMCAKMGIYYDPHEAGADVNAMLRLTAKFPFDIVLERAKSPVVVVQSKQSYGENEKAKKHKFRWNPGEKIWWKAVKEIDMSDLNGAVNGEFAMVVREDLSPEDLDTE